MSKHITDKPHRNEGGRLRHFVEQERRATTHPSSKALHERAHERSDDGARTDAYTRIERGEES